MSKKIDAEGYIPKKETVLLIYAKELKNPIRKIATNEVIANTEKHFVIKDSLVFTNNGPHITVTKIELLYDGMVVSSRKLPNLSVEKFDTIDFGLLLDIAVVGE